MKSISPELAELARFSVETAWEDLPAPVVHETKRLLLDSIGCALAGIAIDPGKIAVALARRLGGPPEASIIGVGDKVSCSSAVLANGQLVNAADYDALPGGGHTPPYIVPPPLAIAEMTGASGKELILATAIGFEIASRMSLATRTYLPSEKPGWGPSTVRTGYAYCNFGAAAGAGKILKFNREKMANTLGLAGHLCQVLTWGTQGATLDGSGPMTKYGVPGWQNTGGVMAALLAEMGYMGDTMVLNPEAGFWHFCGYGDWHPERIVDGIGKTWQFITVNYKLYPSCRTTHAPLECFLRIMEHNHLTSEEIESVRVFGPQIPKDIESSKSLDTHFGLQGFFKKREINSVLDIQFSIPNVFAIAANRLPVGMEWQDLDRVKTPEILDFARKVSFHFYPEENKNLKINTVEVLARGKVYKGEVKTGVRGSPIKGLQMTDEELAEKFRHNASRILTRDKVEGAIKTIFELEKTRNIQGLIPLITL